MKKDGWKIKKLGDVAGVFAGQAAPKNDSDFGLEGIPFIRAGYLEALLSGKDEYSFPRITLNIKEKYKLKLYSENSILFAKSGMSATLNRVYKLQHDSYIVSHLAIVGSNTRYLNSDFLKYYLIAYKPSTLIKDPSYPSISLSDVKEISIPVPSLPIQEQIVKELDTLSEIIAKKKEQLAQLDTLAQATFYDMFGDPVENEKGWETKNLGELGDLKNGLNYTRNEEGRILPFLGVSDFKENRIISTLASTISLDILPQDDYFLRKNDFVFVRSNGSKELVGRCILFNSDINNAVYSGFCIRFRLISTDTIPLYLLYVLTSKQVRNSMFEAGRGANISNVNQQMLSSISVPIPPLPLQNQFAERIEAIEKQKELINKSIVDVQLLFDFTMDKYFN